MEAQPTKANGGLLDFPTDVRKELRSIRNELEVIAGVLKTLLHSMQTTNLGVTSVVEELGRLNKELAAMRANRG